MQQKPTPRRCLINETLLVMSVVVVVVVDVCELKEGIIHQIAHSSLAAGGFIIIIIIIIMDQ